MLDSNFFLTGYLTAVINITLLLLVFFLLLEVIRDFSLFKIPADIIISACGALVFTISIPLATAIEQFLKNTHVSLSVLILKSTIDILPIQLFLIMFGMIILAITKCNLKERA